MAGENLLKAVFVKSSAKPSECPKTGLPEIAFIGRSNVGKSSLINMLTRRKALAKTSSTPGKTQLINHFLVNDQWYLVDLPGFGYAKVSKSKRKGFGILIENYFKKRESLACALVLIDSRISPQKTDLDFIRFLGQNLVPFVIVFTKTDIPSQKELKANLKLFLETLEEEWEELPRYFISSSRKQTGREELLAFIGEAVELHRRETASNSFNIG